LLDYLKEHPVKISGKVKSDTGWVHMYSSDIFNDIFVHILMRNCCYDTLVMFHVNALRLFVCV
jgi:hypothetical protein